MRLASSAPERKLPAAPPETSEVQAEMEAVVESAPRAAEAPESQGTVSDVLRGFWGEQWDAVQPKLAAEGIDPSQPFTLVPWESVEARLREHFLETPEAYAKETVEFYGEWPATLTFEWLEKTFRLPEGFTESDLYVVEEVVAPYNAEIESLAFDYSLGVCQALEQKWDSGDFVRVPRSTKLIPRALDASDNFFAKATGSGSGWCLKMTLRKTDYPDLVEKKDRMVELQRERDRKLVARLGEWSR